MANDFMSDEDKALFREHMRSVKPLNQHSKKANYPVQKTPVKPIKIIKPVEIDKTECYLSDYISEPVSSDSILSYSHSSLPSRRFRDLTNGQIAWEERLDLHGLKAEDARQILWNFIQKQIKNDKRCLLIIHGKGGHQGAPPVIKNLVNRWLVQINEVIAFHSALAKDGGNGAVYVLLKRNKNREQV